MRVGAVNYLNSKPLVHGLERLLPEVRLAYDLPSRLADSLAAGRLDVALIPSVELFRTVDYTIVSNACVACDGPVLSVKLFFRRPPDKVRSVALDEGSRTSAALTQILLAELHGVAPKWEPLPIGQGAASSRADAVLLIGDRAIGFEGHGADGGVRPAGNGNPIDEFRSANGSSCDRTLLSSVPPLATGPFCETWDLGEVWNRWTGLPFVFAMWVARPGVDAGRVASLLAAARDEGVRHVSEIAAREGRALRIPAELATRYLSDNLHFTLGAAEREGLREFYRLCVRHGLAPGGLERLLKTGCADECTTR
jgi:chorismate dehydratase